MKDRKKTIQNSNVRGADSGVKGFKGSNWQSNVFNPYSKLGTSTILNESIQKYKTILPLLNKQSANKLIILDGEAHIDKTAGALRYENEIIPESDFPKGPSQTLDPSRQSLKSNKLPKFRNSISMRKSASQQGGLLSNKSLMKTPLTLKQVNYDKR